MRAVKAKAIRKQIYGDQSHRQREYAKHHGLAQAMAFNPFKRNEPVICTGLRRAYQDAKRVAA